jgi:hypothetical protein
MSVQGMRQLKARIHAIADTSQLLRGIQLDTIAGAKARVPRKTGFLGRSIVPGNVSDTLAIVYVNAPYAAPVEFGSKAHVIVPKRARVLAWPSAEGSRRLSGRARKGTQSGDMTFAAKVNHPGSKAQPFVRPAAEEAVKKHGVDAIVKVWNDAG